MNEMEKRIVIEGMSCEHCKANVTRVLLSIDNVKGVDVILEKGIAIVQMDEEVADEILKEKIDEIGFTVVSIEKGE